MNSRGPPHALWPKPATSHCATAPQPLDFARARASWASRSAFAFNSAGSVACAVPTRKISAALWAHHLLHGRDKENLRDGGETEPAGWGFKGRILQVKRSD
ncbi:hypothetical protein DRW03_32075 [Corallococcus sp. H22C18031201]|nr:hypothetical protein DRW03_32075 [Corallococcus sp. H22C18031201]